MPTPGPTVAEVVVPARALDDDLTFWTSTLGFRLETIQPADDPRVAVVAGHGLRLRIEQGAAVAPGRVRLTVDDPGEFGGASALVAPGGTRVEIVPRENAPRIPATEHAFSVRRLRDGAPWVVGRAGMRYRDLIPGRLGGAVIASHIRVPGGGEVPDMVHHHTVGFQLIFCHRGWVDVLYEDQGDGALRLAAGDCVIQPPGIRHRVCSASPDIEVLEIGVPAEHMTTIDHGTVLPNGWGDPAREWDGQRFVHPVGPDAPAEPFRLPGFVAVDTGIGAGTHGTAGVWTVRCAGAGAVRWRHGGDILFGFVRAGNATLGSEGAPGHVLGEGDAFVVPPRHEVEFSEVSPDFEFVEVALPGVFPTEILPA